MTGEHEVISAISTVPKGVFGGDDSHIIRHKFFERSDVVRVRLVEVLYHQGYTEGHEVNVSISRILCPELTLPMLYLVYESPLCCVYVFARPIVYYW